MELNGICEFLVTTGSTKFKYLVMKNIETLKPSVNILKTLEEDIKKGVADFEKDRNDLIIKLGVPGEGNTVYIDRTDEKAVTSFNQELAELIEKHKDVLDIYEAKFGELQIILDENIDEVFTFRTFSIDDLPSEGISEKQLDLLDKSGMLTD